MVDFPRVIEDHSSGTWVVGSQQELHRGAGGRYVFRVCGDTTSIRADRSAMPDSLRSDHIGCSS